MEAVANFFQTATPDFWLRLVLWLVLGFVVGVLSAMLGIGGGTVMVPMFKLIGGFSALASSATSIFVIVPTGIAGVVNHLRARTCVVKIGLASGIAGACTSVLGAKLADISPSWCIIVAAVLVIGYSAFSMLRKALRPQPKAAPAPAAPSSANVSADIPASSLPAESVKGTTQEQAVSQPAQPAAEAVKVSAKQVLFAALIGLGAGLMSGFVGVGGGFIMVPLFCSVLHLSMRQAAGTSLLAIFCLATPAAIAQLVMGNVLVDVGIMVALGSIPGTFAGQRLAQHMSDRALRLVFSMLLFFAAIMMLLNEFGLVG